MTLVFFFFIIRAFLSASKRKGITKEENLKIKLAQRKRRSPYLTHSIKPIYRAAMEQNFIAAVGTFTNTRKCTTAKPTIRIQKSSIFDIFHQGGILSTSQSATSITRQEPQLPFLSGYFFAAWKDPPLPAEAGNQPNTESPFFLSISNAKHLRARLFLPSP